MNKLLLLATSLICLSLKGYPAGIPNQRGNSYIKVAFNDSTDKNKTPVNPNKGFTDLFESTLVNGVSATRLNPRAVSFVEDYISTEGERLNKMKGWGKPFFDRINTVFTKQKLPVELKYLAVIESDLKSSATSWVGAAGPWQFMPGTARGLGLKVNKNVDERRDFNKSTLAAARYLNSLFDIYHDWLLVIAAYNGGPGNVNSAIRKSGSRNFWDLQNYLPAESRNHVKKFIATHYIMEGDGGLTTLTRKETDDLALLAVNSIPDATTTVLTVTGKYSSIAISQQLQIDQAEFNRLNPNFDRLISANGSYDMKLPNDKVNAFQVNKPQILEQSIKIMLAGTR